MNGKKKFQKKNVSKTLLLLVEDQFGEFQCHWLYKTLAQILAVQSPIELILDLQSRS